MKSLVNLEKNCDEFVRIWNKPIEKKSIKQHLESRTQALIEIRSKTIKQLHAAAENWGWEEHQQLNTWFSKQLAHNQKKWFVAAFFSIVALPDELFDVMIMAGVLEVCPSSNRTFIEICVKHQGLRAVLQSLVHYVRVGSNAEKAGAIQARYWASDFKNDSTLKRLKLEFRELILDEFIENNDLLVRTNIVPYLEPEAYPESMHEKFYNAAIIARNHDSEYIRHRIALQLKEENMLKKNGFALAMAKPVINPQS